MSSVRSVIREKVKGWKGKRRPTLNLEGACLMPPSSSQHTRRIRLPNQKDTINQFGIDIGGSLAKIVYYEECQPHDDDCFDYNHRRPGGRLCFAKFETSQIHECLDFIIEKGLHKGAQQEHKTVIATGGGAYKYAHLIERRLGVAIEKKDEMECLITGLNFLLESVTHESYTFSYVTNDPNPRTFLAQEDEVYPYLLVQIGSGVSVIRVDDKHTFERVDGSSLGGGTFWGLCSLLTGCTDFDEMLELASNGDNFQVDLTVGDIYGGSYAQIGLKPDVLASCFGKVVHELHGSKPDHRFRCEDIAMSLLKMVSNNIAQIAYLNAMRYNIKKIYFGGFFIRDHSPTMAKISYGIHFWSKGTMKALFLLHEGYLGALGAFLKSDECEVRRKGDPDNAWLQRVTGELKAIFNIPHHSNSHSLNHNNYNSYSHNNLSYNQAFSRDQKFSLDEQNKNGRWSYYNNNNSRKEEIREINNNNNNNQHNNTNNIQNNNDSHPTNNICNQNQNEDQNQNQNIHTHDISVGDEDLREMGYGEFIFSMDEEPPLSQNNCFSKEEQDINGMTLLYRSCKLAGGEENESCSKRIYE